MRKVAKAAPPGCGCRCHVPSPKPESTPRRRLGAGLARRGTLTGWPRRCQTVAWWRWAHWPPAATSMRWHPAPAAVPVYGSLPRQAWRRRPRHLVRCARSWRGSPVDRVMAGNVQETVATLAIHRCRPRRAGRSVAVQVVTGSSWAGAVFSSSRIASFRLRGRLDRRWSTTPVRLAAWKRSPQLRRLFQAQLSPWAARVTDWPEATSNRLSARWRTLGCESVRLRARNVSTCGRYPCASLLIPPSFARPKTFVKLPKARCTMRGRAFIEATAGLARPPAPRTGMSNGSRFNRDAMCCRV